MWEVRSCASSTYAQRAELLGKIADLLATRRDEWYEIARKNSGNTKADAAIDVDGSIGTLKYFAKIGDQARRCAPASRWLAHAAGARPEFSGLACRSAARWSRCPHQRLQLSRVGSVGEGRRQPAGGRARAYQACDFDGMAGAGDGQRRGRGGHSSARARCRSCAARRTICSIICGWAMSLPSPARLIRALAFVNTRGSPAGRAREHRGRQPELPHCSGRMRRPVLRRSISLCAKWCAR